MTAWKSGEQASFLLAAAEQAHLGDARISARDVPEHGVHDRVIDPISCADGDPDIRALWGGVGRRDVDWESAALDNANNSSVVVRFRLGKASFLVTGDLEKDGIAELVKKFGASGELRAQVYEVGHHGSWNATTKELLDAIQPHVAIIAMGQVSREDTWSAWAYGHPRIETIELLEAALAPQPKRAPIHVSVGLRGKEFQPRDVSAPIYATGWDGDVTVTMHADGGVVVRAHKDRAH